MYKLVICDDEGKTTVVPLIRDEVTIGRKEGNTIRLTDRNVSRFHARVIREDDAFRIEDLGGMCGTKVNATVLKLNSEIISTGDKISIGDYSLSIRTDVSPDVPLGRQIEPGNETGIGKVTPHARLVMLNNPKPGYEIDLLADLYVIGRSEEANCRIHDPSISRAHARIDFDMGKWTISDLASADGIRINGLRKDDYMLKAGDIIELGAVHLRFVSPGEPYEFTPKETDEDTKTHLRPQHSGPTRMFYLLGAVAAVAVAVIIVTMVLLSKNEKKIPKYTAPALVQPTNDIFESLMEQGKDKMQSEEWAEAAGLFALALQKTPSSASAREMKELAITESDAQKAFDRGLATEEAGKWKEAVVFFESIPRSSRYYDVDQLRRISDKLCDELLEKALRAAEFDDLAEAELLLDEIGGIPETSNTCRVRKETALAKVTREMRAESELESQLGRGVSPSGHLKMKRDKSPRKKFPSRKGKPKPKPKPNTGFKRPVNPYAS